MNSKVVLVTGASRGIGRSLAIEFGKQGYIVYINYKANKDSASDTESIIKGNGGKAKIICADVSDSNQVKTMISEIKGNEGQLDVVINNAGNVKSAIIANMTEESWDEVIKTNLTGTFNVTRESSRIMMRRKRGSVINISSIAAAKGNYGAANYSASKAGIISFTKTAAIELGKFNICVNCILPGFHLTDMGKNNSERYINQAKSDSVLSQTADINELSKFVFLLAESKTVSGQVFNWDSRII